MKNTFEKELDQLAKRIDSMIQTHDYALGDIFPKSFMLNYTNSTSIENFLMNSPASIDFSADLKNLSDLILDQYVSNNTPFPTWQAMYTQGVKNYLAKELGLQ